jgi:hypothetical protein
LLERQLNSSCRRQEKRKEQSQAINLMIYNLQLYFFSSSIAAAAVKRHDSEKEKRERKIEKRHTRESCSSPWKKKASKMIAPKGIARAPCVVILSFFSVLSLYSTLLHPIFIFLSLFAWHETHTRLCQWFVIGAKAQWSLEAFDRVRVRAVREKIDFLSYDDELPKNRGSVLHSSDCKSSGKTRQNKLFRCQSKKPMRKCFLFTVIVGFKFPFTRKR